MLSTSAIHSPESRGGCRTRRRFRRMSLGGSRPGGLDRVFCRGSRWGLAADVASHERVSNVNGARLGGPHLCCLFVTAPTSRQWTNARVSRRHTGRRRLAELAELAERVKIRSPSHDSPWHVGHPLTGRPRPYEPPSHLSVFRASYIPPALPKEHPYPDRTRAQRIRPCKKSRLPTHRGGSGGMRWPVSRALCWGGDAAHVVPHSPFGRLGESGKQSSWED